MKSKEVAMTEELFDLIRNSFSCDAYLNDFMSLLEKNEYRIVKNSELAKIAGHIVADELSKRLHRGDSYAQNV